MSDKLHLGAFESITNQYVLPFKAEKGKIYKCADCSQRVLLRKGNVRKAHFAHYVPTNTCTYYEHPNESQMHKDAKYKLAERLNDKYPININNDCPKCTVSPAVFDNYNIEYLDGDRAVVEYRDINNKWIADVALINNDKIRYIFEIKHTHATITNVRPEPWFEFTTDNIFQQEQEVINNPNDEYFLSCVRTGKNRYCDNCRIESEDWVNNLPRLNKKYGVERMWKQDNPCIVCKGYSYSPVFIKGFRQICKMCICSDENNLKEKYSNSECLMLDD